MAHPLVMFCSDMWTFGATAAEGRPATEAYGAFPRVLGRDARESRLLGLEEAVRKMTWAPAQKIGAFDRGLGQARDVGRPRGLRPGYDLDRATYADPSRAPVGIEYVVVNGVVTVEKDTHLGKRAGMVVRRQSVAR